MKKIYIFYSVILLVFSIIGCTKEGLNSDVGKPIDESKCVTVYGQDYPIGMAIAWENNARLIYKQSPHQFSYTNSSGDNVTLDGYKCETDIELLGNYMISLYEPSFSYIEDLNEVKGEGVVTTLNITTADPNVIEGTYEFSGVTQKNTFFAFHSTNYSTLEDRNVATIVDGSLTIRKIGEEYLIEYDLKNEFGGTIKGRYEGNVKTTKVALQSENRTKGIRMNALQEECDWVQYMFGMIYDLYSGLSDTRSAAYFSTSMGAATLSDTGTPEKIDVCVLWNKEEDKLYFISPLESSQYLNEENSFPNHTEYTMAPSDFTEEDYNNVEISEIATYFSKSTIPAVFDIENFKPGYVFFKSGQGLMGVISVENVTPSSHHKDIIMANMMWNEGTNTPGLIISARSPGNFSSPQIK